MANGIRGQLKNWGLAIACAYAIHDEAAAARTFQALRLWRSTWNLLVEDVPIYDYMLLSAPDGPAINDLRREAFGAAMDDQSLEQLVVAAQINGAEAWLSTYSATLLDSPIPGEQAQAITLAGFRTNNPDSDRILRGEYGTGFLGDVAKYARENYRRDAWASHWATAAFTATSGTDYWRFATLAEGVVDGRYRVWVTGLMPSQFAASYVERFAERLERRLPTLDQATVARLYSVLQPQIMS